MNLCKKIIICLFLLCCTFSADAQSPLQVLDASTEKPIVSVLFIYQDDKGENRWLYSDAKGEVNLSGISGEVTVQHIGYQTFRFEPAALKEKRIFLDPLNQELPEVGVAAGRLERMEIGHVKLFKKPVNFFNWPIAFPLYVISRKKRPSAMPPNAPYFGSNCYSFARLLKPEGDAPHYVKRVAVYIKGAYEHPFQISFYPNIPSDSCKVPQKLCPNIVVQPNVKNDWQYVELPSWLQMPEEGLWLALDYSVYCEEEGPQRPEPPANGRYTGPSLLDYTLNQVKQSYTCRVIYEGEWHEPLLEISTNPALGQKRKSSCYLLKAEVLVEQP